MPSCAAMAVRLNQCSITTTDAGYFLGLTELRTEGDVSCLRGLAVSAHGAEQGRRGMGDRGSRQTLERAPPVRSRIVVLECGAQDSFMLPDPADDSLDERRAEFGESCVGSGVPVSSLGGLLY